MKFVPYINKDGYFKYRLKRTDYAELLMSYMEFCYKYKIPLNKITFILYKFFKGEK